MNSELRENFKSILTEIYYDAMAECDRDDAEGVLLLGIKVDVNFLGGIDAKEVPNE